MKLSDFYRWGFNPDLKENSEIECQECKEWSIYSEWKEIDVPCGICGEHSAMMCPKCEAAFDHVTDLIFNTREANP